MCTSVSLKRHGAGYTVVELLIVLAILGFLSLAVFPMAEITYQREREKELRKALWEIRDAIDAYKRASDQGLVVRSAGQSGYPPNLQALVEGLGPSVSDGTPRMKFLRRVPRDPFAPAEIPAHQTWGLRSYASPAERPQPGEDVYDVFSRSESIGLNGIPLKEW